MDFKELDVSDENDDKNGTTEVMMPHNYLPSLSSGTFGLFTCNYPLSYSQTQQSNDDEKKYDQVSESDRIRLLAKAKEEAKQDKAKFVMENKQYCKEHATPNVPFEKMTVPTFITTQPCKQQINVISSMYKHMLFSNTKTAPKLGGWTLLAVKNWKRCKNSRVLSPKELGLDIIEPRFKGDPLYVNNIIQQMRDGNIIMKSAVGKSGSYYVEFTVDNLSDQPQTITFQIGQVFEQSSVNKVQNLAIKGWSKYCKIDGIKLKYDDPVQPKIMSTVIPANTKDYLVCIECLCMDNDHSGPSGEPVNATPFKSDAPIDFSDPAAQSNFWDHLNNLEKNTVDP